MTDTAVVYDDSALMAYAHGQIGAAELISEVNAEGRHVGVPSTCLAAALAELTDEWDIMQLMRLVRTKTVVILPLAAHDANGDPAEAVRQVSEFARLADCELTVGHAVAEAIAHQAYYVTAKPGRAMEALPPSWPILDLSPVRLVSDLMGVAPVATTTARPALSSEVDQGAGEPDGEAKMPSAVQPMLATPGPVPTSGEWGYEFKWDGVRTIAYVDGGEVKLLTRTHDDVTETYPELAVLGRLFADRRVVLDGEIVALGRNGLPSFPVLQQRMRTRRPTNHLLRTLPVRFYAFDLLYLDGTDFMPLSYVERRDALQRLDVSGDTVDTPPYWTGDVGSALIATARELGLEGVMAKRLSSPYQPGRRSPAWVKTPLTRTIQVVVGGYKPGGGRRAGTIGSLLVGMYKPNGELAYVGNINAGLSEATLRDLHERLDELRAPASPFDEAVPRDHAREAHWVRPVLVADVNFRSWTVDRRLRQPSWQGLRSDVEPADVRLPQ